MKQKVFEKMITGYHSFREKYVLSEASIMQSLSQKGQQPQIMVVACCDSRVDPALILQCEPGDLFVVRNVANIIPPFEKDEGHHGTSAALEFGICYLNVSHLIILGHSQCGGIQALLEKESLHQNDFITSWVSLIQPNIYNSSDDQRVDACAKDALQQSHQNCLSFPWICARVDQQELIIHQWFFDIKTGQIFYYSVLDQCYQPLDKRGFNF